MNGAKRLTLLCLAMIWLAGCAVRKYQPAPISPAETAARLENRNLQDERLREFLEKNIGRPLSSWPLQSWDLSTLTLAAVYFSSEMEMARARVEGANAAIITAGARPNPTLSVQPGVPSPYLFTLDLDFPIETAGKRGYRIEGAKQLTTAAQLDLATTAWKVRSQVRQALLDYMAADRETGLAHTEEHLQSTRVSHLTSRLTAGEVARSDVDSARVDLANTRLAIRTAEGHLWETKTTLAAAIGVPVVALEAVQVRWPDFDRPPGADSLLPQTVQRDALLNRLDVRESLAEYAAAEADLQLEIAKQYPDIDIGPGYTYEERNSFFTVGLVITLPIRNRNQGPIAEAEARRRETAGRFLGTQARVIAETETALASYRAALAELSQAEESLSRVHEPRERVTRASVTLGESDPLTLNDVQLQGLAAMRAKTGALVRTQTALGALEDAVQRPLGGEGPIPQSNPVSLSNSGLKGMNP